MRRHRSPTGYNRYTRKEGQNLTMTMARHGVSVIDLAAASGEPPAMIESAMDYPKNNQERCFAACIVAVENWIARGVVSDFLAGAKKCRGQF